MTQSTFGLFAIPVALALGVPSVALAFGLFSLVTGVSSPIVGWLVDRFDIQRVQRLGAWVLILGLLGSGLAQEPWHFHAAMGVLCGVGVTAFTQLPVNILVTRFISRRLLPAFGVVTAGAGIGGLIAVPLTERVIGLSGWRAAYVGYSFVVAAIWVVFDRWLSAVARSDGAESVGVRYPSRGRSRTSTPETTAGDAPQSRITRGEVQVVSAAAFSGAQRTLMVAFFIPWAISRGIAVSTAAQAFAVAEGCRALSGVVVSFIGQRFGPRVTYVATTNLAAISLLGLVGFGYKSVLLLFGGAVLYGIASGGIHPASSAFQSQVYRPQRLGTLFGASSASYGIGGAVFIAIAERLARGGTLDAVILLAAGGLLGMAVLIFGVRPRDGVA